jgi:hypothetical protein
MQHSHHIMVLDLCPQQFSWMRPATHAPAEEQMVLMKVANQSLGGAGLLKAAKDLANGGLYLQIGIKDSQVAFGVTHPNRQGQFEGPTPCTVPDPALQARAKHKKLSF